MLRWPRPVPWPVRKFSAQSRLDPLVALTEHDETVRECGCLLGSERSEAASHRVQNLPVEPGRVEPVPTRREIEPRSLLLREHLISGDEARRLLKRRMGLRQPLRPLRVFGPRLRIASGPRLRIEDAEQVPRRADPDGGGPELVSVCHRPSSPLSGPSPGRLWFPDAKFARSPRPSLLPPPDEHGKPPWPLPPRLHRGLAPQRARMARPATRERLQ